jgi:hypothetical protein
MAMQVILVHAESICDSRSAVMMYGISNPLTSAESLEPLKPGTSVGCARLLQARRPSRMLQDMVDVMPIFDLSSAGKMSIRRAATGHPRLYCFWRREGNGTGEEMPKLEIRAKVF